VYELDVPGLAPVYAAYDGVVDFVYAPGGVPRNVYLKHVNVPVNGNIEPIVCTYYEHMKDAGTGQSTIFPQFQVAGAVVQKGEQIGWVGNGQGTNSSTFTHLHFGVAIGLYNGGCNRPYPDLNPPHPEVVWWTDPSPFLGINVNYNNGARQYCYTPGNAGPWDGFSIYLPAIFR
jgi:murein DD-endopeptidase MepM/ murein hydrolase activator NlpD